ncbi:DUF6603 domain-containing protein [Mesorhizobium sp. CO1-1-8]|uniref:DUF6603 domain-containing protein n=1 Tax=Mesorhizobium sp. CO1-1-8 TaxID=2876631 RepID=UPI001CD156DE|nr:DUF6603 domain-containing protein [Mesorhizobium sp. CO1-1-8]MBZ9772622.1 hypothetical protein [Mesorhizobium sp. CO1-1-8]
MAGRDTLARLASELTKLLSPLAELTPATAPRLLAELGLVLTPAQAQSLAPALTALVRSAGRLAALNLDLSAKVDTAGGGEVRLSLVDEAVKLIASFAQLQSALAGLGLPGAAPIIAQLPARLRDYLLVRYFARSRGVNELFELAGILTRTDHNIGTVDPNLPFFTSNSFDFGRIPRWFSDARGLLAELYGWGQPGFDGKAVLSTVERLLAELGLPVLYDPSLPLPRLDAVYAAMAPRPDVVPHGLEIELAYGIGKGTMEITRHNWSLSLGATADILAGTKLLLQPGQVGVEPPDATSLNGRFGADYTATYGANAPLPLVDLPGLASVTAEGVTASLAIGIRPTGEGVPEFGIDLHGGHILISTAGADGFIANILGGLKLESNFDLGVGFSDKDGIYLKGSGGLVIQLASHIGLGPVDLRALTLAIGIDQGKFPVAVTADLKAALGPLVGIVEGLGVKVEIAFTPDGNGNLGLVSVQPGFRPPKGIGVSLDVGVVRGGGYLSFDPDRAEYAGAIELAFLDIVTIKAIGLLTTRMPDGNPGFSLLIIMSVEFGTGIQLGFGFTLLAVGGLVGLNRTMNIPALMTGIRTGAVQSVMFPRDIIANAPRIISDLRVLFPPREGTFLIGPMAKLGWGTPTLISVSLGVIIEIPGNIAIVGIVKVAIPTEDAALIQLQVNFAGAIEFDKKRLYFFAALYDSRIVFLTLEGEMGLLLAFGDDANFVLSVGGFHPSFSPPPLPFPSPRRIAVSLISSPLARVRVRVECYFAVTSNTVQFGARVDVVLGFDEFGVKGHLAIDALFQFSPFRFIVEISASFSVDVFGAGLFSVRVTGSLQGPAQWRVKGHGSISVLFWDLDVDINESWGEDRPVLLPPIEVMPFLTDELAKPQNWRALPPASGNLLVSLRPMPAEEASHILHPIGVLAVSQRAVPLEIKLDRIGNRRPSDVNRVAITVAAGGLDRVDDAMELFAPAQFRDFSDADKLSRPAFASEKSGLHLAPGGTALRTGHAVVRNVRYEEIIIDNNFKRYQRSFFLFASTLFSFFLGGAAISKASVSAAAAKKLQPFDDKISIVPEAFGVALQSTNKPLSAAAASFASESLAHAFLTDLKAADPALASTLHIVPSFEMAA